MPSVIGKYTEALPSVRVALETKEALERKAASIGMSFAEYHRLLLMVNAHGIEEVQRLQAERLRVVSGLSDTK